MTTQQPAAEQLDPALERVWTQVQGFIRSTGRAEFEAADVHLRPQDLGELVNRWYLVLAYGSKQHKVYRIADPERDKHAPGVPPAWVLDSRREALEHLRDRAAEAEQLSREEAERQAAEAVPANLFRGIVGYGPVKDLMLRTMQGRMRVHFMLIGPPAGGKSLFLDAIDELPRSLWLQGGMTTRAGFADLIVKEAPDYILLDEADYLTQEDWSPFVEMLERRTVTVTNGNMRVQVERDAQVFVALNDYTAVPPKIRSRFRKIELPAYSREEFVNVGEHVLFEREEIERGLAREIAEWGWHYGIRDIRELRHEARTVHNIEEFKTWMESPYRFKDDGRTRTRKR